MNRSPVLLIGFTLCVAGLLSAGTARETKEAERLENATVAINEIMQSPDNGIPQDLLDRAVCAGIVGRRRARVCACDCRQGGDGAWGAPSMFTVGGGSWGLQIGGESTDIVFIVMNAGGIKKLLQSGVRLGADASAAAGPVGRTSGAATDVQLHAEILSYSRSRGLFAGLSLAGAVLRQDGDGNHRLYGREVSPQEILIEGKVPPPPPAKSLDAILTKYSPHGGSSFGIRQPPQESTKKQG